MTRERPTDPRRAEVRQGLVSRLLALLGHAIKWLVLSLVFSILTEWIGLAFWWPDEGLDHSRRMLATEIAYLQADFGRSLLSSDPVRFARSIVDTVYHVLFELTRFVDLIEWLGSAPLPGERGLRLWLHGLYGVVADYVLAAMQITQVFSVRLAILALAMPVFGMFSLVAIVDGLVQRDLRRWGGGRESSFVYHWAKRSALPLLVLAWVIYLSLPFSLNPGFVVLPVATLFALSVAVTAGTFKKYL